MQLRQGSETRAGRATATDLAAMLVLFALVCGPFLSGVLESAFPGGWDGVPHYAVADLYARKLFPSLGGWLDEFFAGMPFPTFYPPVFYLVVAALTKVGLSTARAYWTVQIVGSAAVPCLTYLGARALARRPRRGGERETGRVAGLVAGAVTVGLMVDRNVLWRLGITLPSTFDAGLATQLLGHVFLLAFVWTLLEAEGEGRAWLPLSAVFFALVPLTNVHMVWAAAFLFLCIAAARLSSAPTREARLAVLLRHGAVGLVAVLLSACWVIPMIARLRYVPTQALEPPPPGAITFAFLRLGTYLVLATGVAAAFRDRRALGFSAALGLLLAFTVLPSARFLALSELAIQPSRVVVPFAFLATFLVGYLASAAREALDRPWTQPVAGLAVVVVFFVRFKIVTAPEANVSADQAAGYENALAALDGRTDGRVLVEMGTDGVSDPFALQSLAGMRGARSVTTVFREASIGVLFAVPLRNSFSEAREAFGVDHKIDGAALKDDPPEAHLARLRLFGVRYLAVRSPATKARLAVFPGIHRASPEGRWELWELEGPAPGYAIVPAYAPVLTFATFSVKPRPDDGVDFVRLGEEMFAAARLEVPLVLAREPRLDRADDWERFRVALITSYRYDDLGRAFDAIERASRTRPIVLWPSDDPLFMRLSELARSRPNLHVVARPLPDAVSTVTARRAVGRESCRRILDAVDEVRTPLAGAARVVSARLEGGVATIELDRAPDAPTPVWVRQEFFPSWEATSGGDGEPVYMATPTFQLTFARTKQVELRFTRGFIERGAALLTLIGALGVALLARAARRGEAGRAEPSSRA
jgi:hypothetical protein